MHDLKKYDRSYILLMPESGGYALDGQRPSGTAILEMRSGKGKVTVNVQGLKNPGASVYALYLISSKDTGAIGVFCGEMIPNPKGKCGKIWDFEPDNVGGSGLRYEDINVIAIILKNSETLNEIIAPLAGYRNGVVIWKSGFKEFKKDAQRSAPVNVGKTDIAQNDDKADATFRELENRLRKTSFSQYTDKAAELHKRLKAIVPEEKYIRLLSLAMTIIDYTPSESLEGACLLISDDVDKAQDSACREERGALTELMSAISESTPGKVKETITEVFRDTLEHIPKNEYVSVCYVLESFAEHFERIMSLSESGENGELAFYCMGEAGEVMGICADGDDTSAAKEESIFAGAVAEAPKEGFICAGAVAKEPQDDIVSGESVAEVSQDDIVSGESVAEVSQTDIVSGESVAEVSQTDIVSGESVAEDLRENIVSGEPAAEEPRESIVSGEAIAEEPQTGTISGASGMDMKRKEPIYEAGHSGQSGWERLKSGLAEDFEIRETKAGEDHNAKFRNNLKVITEQFEEIMNRKPSFFSEPERNEEPPISKSDEPAAAANLDAAHKPPNNHGFNDAEISGLFNKRARMFPFPGGQKPHDGHGHAPPPRQGHGKPHPQPGFPPIVPPVIPIYDIIWIQITQEDLRFLPEHLLRRTSNPFVIHAYGKYGHFILGVSGQGLKRIYYLGVPGIYSERDRLIALSLGFTSFIPVNGGVPRNGEFGYWVIEV